jgi:hypothetical protein
MHEHDASSLVRVMRIARVTPSGRRRRASPRLVAKLQVAWALAGSVALGAPGTVARMSAARISSFASTCSAFRHDVFVLVCEQTAFCVFFCENLCQCTNSASKLETANDR